MTLYDHLLSRGLDPRRYPHSVRLDPEAGIASFLLWNLSGQLVGYQQYNPLGDKKQCNDRDLGKYYTYQKESLAVWGLETLSYRPDVLFLTEGVFDVVKFHQLGLPGVAVLQNNPKRLKSWTYALPRRVIAACDNDANKSGDKLKNCTKYWFQPKLVDTDFGDLTVSDTEMLVRESFPWLDF